MAVDILVCGPMGTVNVTLMLFFYKMSDEIKKTKTKYCTIFQRTTVSFVNAKTNSYFGPNFSINWIFSWDAHYFPSVFIVFCLRQLNISCKDCLNLLFTFNYSTNSMLNGAKSNLWECKILLLYLWKYRKADKKFEHVNSSPLNVPRRTPYFSTALNPCGK
jgi:hypothetical protein